MRRREFFALMGAAAIARPVASHAQPARLPTIGFLGAGSRAAWAPSVARFERRLRELGLVDGRTVNVVYRWADGKGERFAAFAAEFVQLKVDVIVTAGSAVAAVKQATSTIPIVFAVTVDPVGSGFVASLARPGGNITGLSSQSLDLAGKRLQLLRQVIPTLSRLAVLANTGYPTAVRESANVQAAARQLGLTADALEVRSAADFGPAINSLKGRTRALYLCTNSLVVANLTAINGQARDAGVATMWGAREFCEAGGFMSYGANERELFGRAADYVDRILKGAKPADLPVEQATNIELVINLKTARSIGLDVPADLLALADEVIE